MPYTYRYEGTSLQNRREKNMDSLLVSMRTLDGEELLLAVICDGVGSRSEGDYAAARAVRMLGEWFSAADHTAGIGLLMREKVLEINSTVEADAAAGIDTASTLSAVLLTPGKYYLVHTGDSRIYLYPHGRELEQLTCDDVSPAGKLTACLGHMRNEQLHYSEGPLESGLILLCSDGFYRRIDRSYLTEALDNAGKKNLKKTVDTLTRYVIDRGENDNVSLAIIKIES